MGYNGPETATVIRQYGKGGWQERERLYSHITDRRDFDSGQMRGRLVMSKYDLVHASGRLEGEALRMWERDWARIQYVVWSYHTPIAWCVAVGTRGVEWVIPDVTYSVTTTRHQGFVQTAMHYQ